MNGSHATHEGASERLSASLLPMPWFEPHRQRFIAQLQQQQLPHATLLTSQQGQGKAVYASQLAQVVLCDHGTGCGGCRSCQLYAYGNHPDMMMIKPMPPSLRIRIDHIRELIEFTTLQPHTADRKVVVIHQLDRLNREASNALLKTLEEPPRHCYLVLDSSFPKTLLPTIQSRVRMTHLPSPTAAQTQDYLTAQFSHQPISSEQIAYAVKRFPSAPMRAADYIADDGVQIEKQLLQWLREQWIDQHLSPLPIFTQLKARYANPIELEQVIIRYLSEVVSTLVIHQARPDLAAVVTHQDTRKLIESIPMALMQSYHRALLQMVPRLDQLTAQHHIAAITQIIQGRL